MNFDEILMFLEKKAKGGIEEETREEFIKKEDNEEMQVVKKVVTKKIFLPDTQALLKLLELKEKESPRDFSKMSDEELQKERKRIIIKILESLSEEERKSVFSQMKG